MGIVSKSKMHPMLAVDPLYSFRQRKFPVIINLSRVFFIFLSKTEQILLLRESEMAVKFV